jgi:hypothetical protein
VLAHRFCVGRTTPTFFSLSRFPLPLFPISSSCSSSSISSLYKGFPDAGYQRFLAGHNAITSAMYMFLPGNPDVTCRKRGIWALFVRSLSLPDNFVKWRKTEQTDTRVFLLRVGQVSRAPCQQLACSPSTHRIPICRHVRTENGSVLQCIHLAASSKPGHGAAAAATTDMEGAAAADFKMVRLILSLFQFRRED